MARLFWATCALVEFQRGNAAFAKYDRAYTLVTSRLNLMEMNDILLRAGRAEEADAAYDAFRPRALDPDDALVKQAMRFRLRMRRQRRRLSYVDAVGYELARSLPARFLRGDPAMRGLRNVEFVR